MVTEALGEAAGGQLELTSVNKPDHTIVPDLDLGGGQQGHDLGGVGAVGGVNSELADEITENRANMRIENETANNETEIGNELEYIRWIVNFVFKIGN